MGIRAKGRIHVMCVTNRILNQAVCGVIAIFTPANPHIHAMWRIVIVLSIKTPICIDINSKSMEYSGKNSRARCAIKCSRKTQCFGSTWITMKLSELIL